MPSASLMMMMLSPAAAALTQPPSPADAHAGDGVA